MLIEKLNTDKVAEILLRVPLISMQLNHKHIKSSLRDYVSPGENHLEAQYVKDLFTLVTDEIIEKWYGGKDDAEILLFKLNEK